MKKTFEQLDDFVIQLMQHVRQQVLAHLQQPLEVKTKSNSRDLVTNVDRLVEQYYVKAIREFDPMAKILGEEGFGDSINSMAGSIWIVDPIDGTLNFVKQQNQFATMVACFEDGQPRGAWILDVMENELLHGSPECGVWLNSEKLNAPANLSLVESIVSLSGARLLHNTPGFQAVAGAALGYRVYGSAGISFIRLARGQVGAFMSYLKPWDFAAGQVLCQTLGLQITKFDKRVDDMLSSSLIVAATKNATNDILALTNTSM
ncbi:inositol monophosphatase family protein [Weissella kandleri]|uniref:inositol monophosphatase family protein n=1 Tax=Weissella kandleri TaxID=1616 RepID=UPI00387E6545